MPAGDNPHPDGHGLPGFVAAGLLITLFSDHLHWLPAGGWGNFRQMILPAIALSLMPLAYIARPYFLGSPATVLGQAEVLHELGIGIVDMAFAAGIGEIDYEHQADVMSQFAEEVMPTVQAW